MNDVHQIVDLIANCRRANKKRKRLVIITRAEKPIIYSFGSKVIEIPVPAIEPEKIVDTSGAGDAFVGGFLAKFVRSEPINKCIECGIWASGLIIQRVGSSFTDS